MEKNNILQVTKDQWNKKSPSTKYAVWEREVLGIDIYFITNTTAFLTYNTKIRKEDIEICL